MTRYGAPRRPPSLRHHHGEGRSPKIGLKGLSLLAIGLVASLLTCVEVWGWGSLPHSQIVDAALTVIPWQDGLLLGCRVKPAIFGTMCKWRTG